MGVSKGFLVGVAALGTVVGLGQSGIFAVASSRNVDDVKQHAADVFKQNGFDIVGYQGYENSFVAGKEYGGGKVWYTLKKTNDNGVTYEGSLKKWGNEYHLYNLNAKDAIAPKR